MCRCEAFDGVPLTIFNFLSLQNRHGSPSVGHLLYVFVAVNRTMTFVNIRKVITRCYF